MDVKAESFFQQRCSELETQRRISYPAAFPSQGWGCSGFRVSSCLSTLTVPVPAHASAQIPSRHHYHPKLHSELDPKLVTRVVVHFLEGLATQNPSTTVCHYAPPYASHVDSPSIRLSWRACRRLGNYQVVAAMFLSVQLWYGVPRIDFKMR